MQTTPAIDAAVHDAVDLPDLIRRLESVDPSMATTLRGKALVASRSPWGALIGGAVALAVARYGLNLGPDDIAMVSGLGVLIGGYALRAVTSAPITGLFRK